LARTGAPGDWNVKEAEEHRIRSSGAKEGLAKGLHSCLKGYFDVLGNYHPTQAKV
jgi:hypothetical protein